MLIAEDGEQPSLEVCARLVLLLGFEGLENGVLHQIVGEGCATGGQAAREGAQMRQKRNDIFAKDRHPALLCSLFHLFPTRWAGPGSAAAAKKIDPAALSSRTATLARARGAVTPGIGPGALARRREGRLPDRGRKREGERDGHPRRPADLELAADLFGQKPGKRRTDAHCGTGLRRPHTIVGDDQARPRSIMGEPQRHLTVTTVGKGMLEGVAQRLGDEKRYRNGPVGGDPGRIDPGANVDPLRPLPGRRCGQQLG